jgi:hypothetical protein
MMGILTLIGAALGAVKALLSWLSQGRLIKAGEDKAVRSGLEKNMEEVERAVRARDSVDHSADSVRRDPDLRK